MSRYHRSLEVVLAMTTQEVVARRREIYRHLRRWKSLESLAAHDVKEFRRAYPQK